jgi:hypothetical protein
MTFNKTATIEAKDVMVGDYLYNSHATHPVFSAARVTSVTQKANEAIITTFSWVTYKHPREGIAIMRLPYELKEDF